ncbi:hypothetical protein [Actinophytocola sediminis]
MTRHPARLLVACLAAAMLLAGCAGELTEQDKQAAADYGEHQQNQAGHRPNRSLSTSSLPSKFLTWQQLAETVGCRAELQGKAADFRQAMCVKDEDAFVFLDFDTKRGQRDWLEYAVGYGGIYLVGDRWVVSGRSREYLEGLRRELGGGIEESDEHSGPA